MSIALIDLSHVFRRHWHATEHSELSEAYKMTVEFVHDVAKKHDHVGICVDAPPYLRKTLQYSEYKANREKSSGLMVGQLKDTLKRLEEDGFVLLSSEGYEADDIIASVVDHIDKTHPGCGHGEVTVYTGDKDLLQLVGNECNKIKVVSSFTGDVYASTEDVAKKFGVFPRQVPDLLAMVGDAADNIIGIKGVGVKTAARYIGEDGSRSLEDVLRDAADGAMKPAHAEAITKDKERLLLNRDLVRLHRDVDLPISELFKKREPKIQEGEIVELQTTETQEDVPKPNGNGTKALAKKEWHQALEPSSIDEAWRVSNMLLQSRLFPQFQSAQAIMAVIMTGRSMGLDAVACLRGFNVIKGHVSPSAATMIGLVKRSRECEYFRLVASDERSATYETRRAGDPEPTRLTYTIEEAQQAGIATNDNWRKRPKTMLRWRCGTELARAVYPDITAGLYSQDEVEDMAA